MRHYSTLFYHNIWYYSFIDTQGRIKKHIMEDAHMVNKEEMLLKQLEREGREIAHYRMELSNMINSGNKINCSKLLRICRKLNEHIESFDQIDMELSYSEKVIVMPVLNASGI